MKAYGITAVLGEHSGADGLVVLHLVKSQGDIAAVVFKEVTRVLNGSEGI